VPVRGKSFLVCVDKKPIYFGAFWTPISSISFDGVTIWKPLGVHEPYVVTLELGYPSASFYGGDDPRNSPEVLTTLEKAGKLVKKLTVNDVASLPHSMKGYELYSWLADSQWHFTLITGTNRNKKLDEIISGEDTISEAGWVNVHLVGIDAVKSALSKLPKGEFLMWLAGMREQAAQPAVNIRLPPEHIVQDIEECASGHCLDFNVQTP